MDIGRSAVCTHLFISTETCEGYDELLGTVFGYSVMESCCYLPSSLSSHAPSQPVLFTLGALHLLSDHLLRLNLITAHTWRVETTYVLVFYEEHSWPWKYDLHMTLVAPKLYPSKATVLDDLHWTARKSLWNEDLRQYVDYSACSKHYDLLAGKVGKWGFGLAENRERGNRQLSTDPDLDRTGLKGTKHIQDVLEALRCLVESEKLAVLSGKIVVV